MPKSSSFATDVLGPNYKINGWHLSTIAVRPRVQRQGIGRRLVKAVEEIVSIGLGHRSKHLQERWKGCKRNRTTGEAYLMRNANGSCRKCHWCMSRARTLIVEPTFKLQFHKDAGLVEKEKKFLIGYGGEVTIWCLVKEFDFSHEN